MCFLQEAEKKWLKYSPSDHIPLMKEVFPLTIKGISRTCMGNVFTDDSELDQLSTAYHNCWREMEVLRVTNQAAVGACSAAFKRITL